ncbi:hypothetical protein [Rosistilla oblonga]|uniref:hypothetical protein n=1 Tax=Rosistilla oblonga TaxID=2527990 RepID=UPI003A96A1D9
MIHSSINDNWMRVTVMHSIARDLYAATADTDFRNRITNGGDTFPFDATAYDTIENESRIVGMVVAWSVVTLESLVNHQLAVTIEDTAQAATAIRYPSKTMKELGIPKSKDSELAKKLVILRHKMSQSSDEDPSLIELANSLADKRNAIVHDKPFRLVDRGDGDVDIEWFTASRTTDSPTFRYDDLPEFYANCHFLKECVIAASPEPLDCDLGFGSLACG